MSLPITGQERVVVVVVVRLGVRSFISTEVRKTS
jgi:hypothetical protein